MTAVEGFDEVDGGVVWVVRGLLLHDFLINEFYLNLNLFFVGIDYLHFLAKLFLFYYHFNSKNSSMKIENHQPASLITLSKKKFHRIARIKLILLIDIDGHGLELITLVLYKNGSLCRTPFSLVFGRFVSPSSLYVILLNMPL